MRLGIDSRPIHHEGTRQRGIGRYVRGLFAAFERHCKGVEVLWADVSEFYNGLLMLDRIEGRRGGLAGD